MSWLRIPSVFNMFLTEGDGDRISFQGSTGTLITFEPDNGIYRVGEEFPVMPGVDS